MTTDRESYTMGYGRAATTIMSLRTAESHAGFLIPYLKPGMNLLDCGCGPGTITIGLAKYVAPGNATGTEIEETQVAIARGNAARQNVSNVRFEAASIYELPFDDASFDAVFISAVLGNLKEPSRGLREAYRVLRPGGVIGVKEFDHGGDIYFPVDPAIVNYNDLYVRLRRENGHDPEGGRKIGSYLLEAGFSGLKSSACFESLTDPEILNGAAELNIALLTDSWADAFKSRGWATDDSISEMTGGWRRFAKTPGAFLAFAWCEAVGWKARA